MFKSRNAHDCGICAIGCLGPSRRAIVAACPSGARAGMTVRQMYAALTTLGFTYQSSHWLRHPRPLDAQIPTAGQWIVLLYEPGASWGHWVYIDATLGMVYDSDLLGPCFWFDYARAHWLVRCRVCVAPKRQQAASLRKGKRPV